GMLTGPFAQASQTPLTSSRPLREWTIRRQSTFSGSPLTCSSMLVPHEVAVRVAVAATFVAGSAPLRVSTAGCGPAAPDESQSPPPVAAARHAAAAAAQRSLVPRCARARPGGLDCVSGLGWVNGLGWVAGLDGL